MGIAIPGARILVRENDVYVSHFWIPVVIKDEKCTHGFLIKKENVEMERNPS